MKYCGTCGKSLPLSFIGEQCGLCSSGFRPLSDPELATPPVAEASASQLTGIECPGCRSELQFSDVQMRSCAACGRVLPEYFIERIPDQVESAELKLAAHEASSTAPSWPSNAPIW